MEKVRAESGAHANCARVVMMVPVAESEAEGAKRFEELAARFEGDPAASRGTGFGSSPGLRIKGKIFAMLVRGELVVKLPKTSVDELVAAGTAHPFDPGHGRLMKEWAAIPLGAAGEWESLVDEAFGFVGSSV